MPRSTNDRNTCNRIINIMDTLITTTIGVKRPLFRSETPKFMNMIQFLDCLLF